MKLAILLFSLPCTAFASAQYMSEGWQPGKQQRLDLANDPPPHVSSPAHTLYRAAEERPPTAPPVAPLFERMGVDFTEAVAPKVESAWDPRIPLITDENFDEVIVREALTSAEEAKRVWFLIISMPEGKSNEVSKLVDRSFDEAYIQTLAAGDLPHIRWGRIDYTNTPFLTTKWSIWSAPYLVVATDRGQTLRFYKADRAHVTPELLRELLTEELWRHTQPWKSDFAPGGSREWILHYSALGLMHLSNFVNRFPLWQLLVGFCAIAVLIMRLRCGAPATSATAECQMQPTGQGGTTECSSAVAKSTALFGCTATSTATASPSKGAISTTYKDKEPEKALRKLKK